MKILTRGSRLAGALIKKHSADESTNSEITSFKRKLEGESQRAKDIQQRMPSEAPVPGLKSLQGVHI